jgi:hypothetical protein
MQSDKELPLDKLAHEVIGAAHLRAQVEAMPLEEAIEEIAYEYEEEHAGDDAYLHTALEIIDKAKELL